MNRFGFNSAAINGTAIRVIAGAAIVLTSFSAQSTGIRTQYGDAQATSQAKLVSSGTRIQTGEAGAVASLSASAKWALLTLAEAKVNVGLVVNAANTEAYTGITTQISATGTAIRNAAAVSLALASASANGLATIGYAANVVLSSDGLADASVKPSGSTSWYRDGYAKPVSIQGLVSATSLRTALASASALSVSSLTADAVRIQGGAASCTLKLYAEATGASDTAWCSLVTQISATGLITRFGTANCQINSYASTSDTVIRPGQAETITSALTLLADGRLAQRGDAHVLLNSNGLAEGRLALIAGTTIQARFTVIADGVVYKVGAASLASSLVTAADAYIIRLGEAKAGASLIASADGATNLQARASTERTMELPFDDRGMAVPFEDRSIRLV